MVSVRGSAQPDHKPSTTMPQQSSWDSSLSSWGRVSTHEVSQQWAPCNRNIKPHLIHLALPILTERDMAFSPFILLASWSLSAQLEKSSLRLWHLQNPSAFQQSSGNVRTAAADSSSPILSPAYPLLHCLPLLSSLPDSIFFVVVLSKLWKHSGSFFCPSSLDPWVALTTAYLQRVARVFLLF